VTDTHLLWTYARHVPFCASPVVVGEKLFWVKDGGIVACLSARTGTPLKQGRLEAVGAYYSSPVAGDGRIYFLSEEGKLTVINAAADWEVLHVAEFGENAYATPALVDGRIYLRTAGHLYCFGADSK
jgi:outer membrane protein assembly factor BamB